jgi:hypothetical protein
MTTRHALTLPPEESHMLVKELTERSPMRAIEKAIHGGLGAGNIGVILARPGVGKTACLVQIGLDAGLRRQNVLHVSMGHTVGRVRDWYAEIFRDMAEANKLEDPVHCLLTLESRRRIHSYLGHTFSVAKLKDTVHFMVTHANFEPRLIVVDGFDLPEASVEDLHELRQIAHDIGAEIWMSGIVRRTDPGYYTHEIPEPYKHLADEVDVFLKLEGIDGSVSLRLIKDHDDTNIPELNLKLNPQSMLIVEE